jgi:ABC-type dipeptide/oligopeptide/nickel transport system permease subunit
MFTVLGINFLGDGLRDALDPRSVTTTRRGHS